MAKFIMLTMAVLLIAATTTIAAPAEEIQQFAASQGGEAVNVEEFENPDDHLRFRRVTCDLLTYGGVVGNSACAANCLSMGKAGGRCNDGVCQCRKTSFGDLWNQRFG